MSKNQNPRRSADEWLKLIQECRSSGLSDADWCSQQGIPSSTFYTALKRCRDKACIIPENTVPVACEKQEVVPVTFGESVTTYSTYHNSTDLQDVAISPVIQIVVNDYKIQISNSCEKSTLTNTLLALRELC